MKNERLLRAMGNVDERFIAEAAPGAGRRRTGGWVKWAAAACACLAVCAALMAPRRGSGLPRWLKLSKETTAKVELAEGELHEKGSKNQLPGYTEEEIFSWEGAMIFRGTVTDITNLRIDFNGEEELYGVLTIQVEKVFKGDVAPGKPIRMLVYRPVDPDGSSTAMDTGVLSRVRVGTEGIFIPWTFGQFDYVQFNGATLMLTDLAQCQLMDGDLWLFLETDRGVAYRGATHPGAKGSATLDDIEAYVVRMLEQYS